MPRYAVRDLRVERGANVTLTDTGVRSDSATVKYSLETQSLTITGPSSLCGNSVVVNGTNVYGNNTSAIFVNQGIGMINGMTTMPRNPPPPPFDCEIIEKGSIKTFTVKGSGSLVIDSDKFLSKKNLRIICGGSSRTYLKVSSSSTYNTIDCTVSGSSSVSGISKLKATKVKLGVSGSSSVCGIFALVCVSGYISGSSSVTLDVSEDCKQDIISDEHSNLMVSEVKAECPAISFVLREKNAFAPRMLDSSIYELASLSHHIVPARGTLVIDTGFNFQAPPNFHGEIFEGPIPPLFVLSSKVLPGEAIRVVVLNLHDREQPVVQGEFFARLLVSTHTTPAPEKEKLSLHSEAPSSKRRRT